MKQNGNVHIGTALATNRTGFVCSLCFAMKLPAQALLCSENIATCLCLGYDLYAAEACNESSSSVSSGKNPVHVLILFYNTRQSQVSEGKPRDLLQKPSSNPD